MLCKEHLAEPFIVLGIEEKHIPYFLDVCRRCGVRALHIETSLFITLLTFQLFLDFNGCQEHELLEFHDGHGPHREMKWFTHVIGVLS